MSRVLGASSSAFLISPVILFKDVLVFAFNSLVCSWFGQDITKLTTEDALYRGVIQKNGIIIKVISERHVSFDVELRTDLGVPFVYLICYVNRVCCFR